MLKNEPPLSLQVVIQNFIPYQSSCPLEKKKRWGGGGGEGKSPDLDSSSRLVDLCHNHWIMVLKGFFFFFFFCMKSLNSIFPTSVGGTK